MSQENVELAGRVLDALARRDVARLVDLSDPEVGGIRSSRRWHSVPEAVIAAMTAYGST